LKQLELNEYECAQSNRNKDVICRNYPPERDDTLSFILSSLNEEKDEKISQSNQLTKRNYDERSKSFFNK